MPLETAPSIPETKSGDTPAAPAPNLKPGTFPEAFGELEELERISEQPAAKAKSEPKPRKAAPKPAAKPAASEEKPTEEPPKEEKKEPAKTVPKDDEPEPVVEDGDPDPAAKFQLAHDLRKEYRKLHKVAQDKDAKIAELTARLNGSPVNNAVLEENKAIKKRLEEVESELRYLDYTKSAEFKEKFEKPYQDAYDDAVEEIKELRVNLDDGNTRPATAQDFQRILQADNQDVRALANQMFGDAAGDVLAARRKLIELNRNANRESKRFREEASERERKKAIQAAEEKEGMRRMWDAAIQTVAEKYPEYFKPIEGDEDYNKELAAGYAVVDRAHDPALPTEERIARLAALRHRAAAFRAQVFINKRLKSRVAELEEVVKGYEESAPQGGSGKGEASRAPHGESDDGYESAMAEIDRLAATDKEE